MHIEDILHILGILFQLLMQLETFSIDDCDWQVQHLKGRFTRDVKDYEVTIPRKLNSEGKFLSYTLPHFYRRDIDGTRERRNTDDANDFVHYGLAIKGQEYVVELRPNRELMSPSLMVEKRSGESLQDTNIHPASSEQCHYNGWIRGNRNATRAAISVCQSGMVGYVKTSDGRRHFIEPVADHQPEPDGRHLHLVYQESPEMRHRKNCGTGDDWEPSWRERLMRERRHYERTESGVRRDVERRLQRVREVLQHPDEKRTVHSEHRFLEILVVADKRFIEYHNTTDRESYILTVMNMANDFYHDASVGNLIDFVVVRIMYLEKEENEIDLVINRNAENTLASFCKWQIHVNPKDISHPNHHDIAVLLTRYDICSDNETECGLLGLAYVAQACNSNQSCCINEDIGLTLGVVVTHEVGHVLGCGHDEVDKSGCEPFSDPEQHFGHVMSPYVQLATNKWSSCSRGFITEFLDNDLGTCLLDEPQEHSFKLPKMPPGAMYDIEWQCRQKFGQQSKSCKRGPKETCEKLWCTMGETEKCGTYGKPPADGTKCGENMWCFERECVDIGSRPAAVDGGWGEWSAYSDCSRTCGGGVSSSERDCNNPAPENHGRYCTGQKKRHRICNTNPCDMKDPSFRASQCSQFDTKPFKEQLHQWKPYNKDSDTACQLICINEQNEARTLAPRVADGTPCKPGTRYMCIAGICHKVGCDWVLDSDAKEDKCGICQGDGTHCEFVEKTFDDQRGNGYVKIATIPAGARRIIVDELKPSPNTIAVADESGKNFYLNGDYNEETDGEFRIAGVVSFYSHPEPDKEMLIIAGPLQNSINLYVCFFDKSNPGVSYKYAVPTTEATDSTSISAAPGSNKGYEFEHPQKTDDAQAPSSASTASASDTEYQSSYSWEFLEWGECSVKCGGGVQMSDPSCVKARSGRVSNSYCEKIQKPEPMARICNSEPCKAHWKIGSWSRCQGCLFKTGCRMRSVTCVKQSPAQDLEVVTEDKECTGKKPETKELCNAFQNCKSNHFQGHNASLQPLVGVTPVLIVKNTSTNQKLIHSSNTIEKNNNIKQKTRLLMQLKNDGDSNISKNKNAYKSFDMHYRTKQRGDSKSTNKNEHSLNSYRHTNTYNHGQGSRIHGDAKKHDQCAYLDSLSGTKDNARESKTMGNVVSIENEENVAEKQQKNGAIAKNLRPVLNTVLQQEESEHINRLLDADFAAYEEKLKRSIQPLSIARASRTLLEPKSRNRNKRRRCIKYKRLQPHRVQRQYQLYNGHRKDSRSLGKKRHITDDSHRNKERLIYNKYNQTTEEREQNLESKFTEAFESKRGHTINDTCAFSTTIEPEHKVTINKADIGTIVKDWVPQKDFELEEAPMLQEKKRLNLSDEASEALGDMIPDIINTKKTEVLTGKQTEEIEKHLMHSENDEKQKHNKTGKS